MFKDYKEILGESEVTYHSMMFLDMLCKGRRMNKNKEQVDKALRTR